MDRLVFSAAGDSLAIRQGLANRQGDDHGQRPQFHGRPDQAAISDGRESSPVEQTSRSALRSRPSGGPTTELVPSNCSAAPSTSCVTGRSWVRWSGTDGLVAAVRSPASSGRSASSGLGAEMCRHSARRIAGMESKGRTTVINAQVPMSEMLTYGTLLTSMTQGKGSYRMEMDHYDIVPQLVADKILANAKRPVEVEEE
jgi:hypothetical protein